MRTIERVTICVVLTIAPFVGTGCVSLPIFKRSGPPPLTRKEPRIFAVQRETPLSAQVDANQKNSPSEESAESNVSKASPETLPGDKSSESLTKVDGKSSAQKSSAPKAVATVKKSEVEPAVVDTSPKPKKELNRSAVTSTSNDVATPTNTKTAQSSVVTTVKFIDDSDTDPESSEIKQVKHDESASSQPEEIVFEIPKPAASPRLTTEPAETTEKAWDAPDADEIEEALESATSAKADQWTSPDEFDVQVEKIEERDFQQVCLVKFREERVFEPGLPEFTVEYRAQLYRFSSAEAAKRFQADPELFVPSAGGLDIVAFRVSQEVVQGSLDFAVWYKQRLFLFRNLENIATFQRQPEKFAATE